MFVSVLGGFELPASGAVRCYPPYRQHFPSCAVLLGFGRRPRQGRLFAPTSDLANVKRREYGADLEPRFPTDRVRRAAGQIGGHGFYFTTLGIEKLGRGGNLQFQEL